MAGSSLPGLFISALRFWVAVIFDDLYGALSAPSVLLLKGALAPASLGFVGESFIMGVRLWLILVTMALCTLGAQRLIKKDRRSHLNLI
jgi:hypothetical protein